MKYFLVFVLLFIIEIFYLKLAKNKNISDVPNHRSAHTKITLRGGGIIILFAILIFNLLFSAEGTTIYFAISAFLVGAISFLDDILVISSRTRVSIHIIAFSLIFYSFGLFTSIDLLALFSLFILYFLSLGMLNIYNFMDGINGITFLNALISYTTLLFINIYLYEFTNSDLLIVLILSILVFGYFNFRKKAICFAGDVGSITIGFSLIYFSLNYYLQTSNILIFLIFTVYTVEGGFTIFERVFRKENIFEAHKRHLYQLLTNDLNISHLLISFGYFILQLIIGLIMLYGIKTKFNPTLLFILLFCFSSVIYILIKYIVLKRLKISS